METLLTLFVFGGFWFWSLIVVASFLFITFLENEYGGWATFLLLSTVAAIVGLGNTDWITWIVANPITILLYIFSYLSIGAGWGIIKWLLYVRATAARYLEEKRRWIVRESKSRPNEQNWLDAKVSNIFRGKIREAWIRYYNIERRYLSLQKPVAVDSKSLITGWMAYWPWSVLWTLINDPIRKFFNWVYESISGLLQKISDHAFKDIDSELKNE